MDDETRKQMNVEGDICGSRPDHRKAGKGDGSLEDAFADYEEGMKLVKSCNEKLRRSKKDPWF